VVLIDVSLNAPNTPIVVPFASCAVLKVATGVASKWTREKISL
jgi:hypothetical protein